jgi:hypothetical protein
MTVAVLIGGGVIFKEPTRRTSQSGRSYVVTTQGGLKLACRELGVEPHLQEWDGHGGTPLDFTISKNLHRRHLTESQRAMIGARITNLKNGQTAAKIKENHATGIPAPSNQPVFADHVMALRQPPKQRKPKSLPAGSKAAEAIAKQSIVPPDPDLNDDLDDLPF